MLVVASMMAYICTVVKTIANVELNFEHQTSNNKQKNRTVMQKTFKSSIQSNGYKNTLQSNRKNTLFDYRVNLMRFYLRINRFYKATKNLGNLFYLNI